MLFIAIMKWKEKCGLAIRLILFLVLLGLVIPKFLNYIAAEIADLKIRPEGRTPPALRVEKAEPGVQNKQPADERFLEKLRIFYHDPQTDHTR
ncbi:MAG TPA: hypothetical protein GXX19_02305 [Syntrophomonadaceae bacterium]|nr:hypothetical protein [Syntrophomonadaceae bacterium]